MDPVEINTGEYYLRVLHDDDLINDLPAIQRGIPEADHDYFELRTKGWESGEHLSWACCHLNDVELLAEIGAAINWDSHHATVSGWSILGAEAALSAGCRAVADYCSQALGLVVDLFPPAREGYSESPPAKGERSNHHKDVKA